MRKSISATIVLLFSASGHAQTLQNYAIVDTAAGKVINHVEYSSQPPSPVPGFGPGTIAVQNNQADQTWTWNGSALVAPPTPVQPAVPPTMLAIISTSTPALSGSYAFDAVTQSKMLAVSLYISVNGKFPAGQTAFPWADAGGTMHTFTSTAQFQSLATALADYATGLALGQTLATPVIIP